MPPDSDTKLLLHFDNDFWDYSGHDHIPNRDGYFTFINGVFDNGLRVNYGKLWFDNHPDWNFADGDFTFDCRCYVASDGDGYQYPFDLDNYKIAVRFRVSYHRVKLYIGSGSYESADDAFPLDEWFHLAVVRNNGVAKVYINGNETISLSNSDTITPTGGLAVGSLLNSSSHIAGIDEFRISSVARWTSNFTPPTESYESASITPPPIDDTPSFLLHFDESFYDCSGNEYIPKLNGYYSFEAGRFDKALRFKYGNLVYTDIDNLKFAGNDFTIDFWLKVENNNSAYIFDSAGSSYIKLRLYSDNRLRLYIASSYYYTPNDVFTLNTWHHIAVVRTGDCVLLFVDGVCQITANVSDDNINPDGNLYIGSAKEAEATHIEGLIDELCVVNGTAKWVTDFDVPRGPYPGDTPDNPPIDNSCDLLLHFDGGAFDSSGNNIAITEHTFIEYAKGRFNDAGSFDGSEMYLTAGSASDWQIGTGDFTIDFWVNIPLNYIYGKYIFDIGGGRLTLRTYSDNRFRLYVNGSYYYTASNAFIPETWHHIAITRTGRVLVMYIDGQSVIVMTNTADIAPQYEFAIGSYYDGSNKFAGLIDEFRLIKQRSYWVMDFQRPAQPYPDPPITQPPINAPIAITPIDKRFTDTIEFYWTKVFTADRYELEIVSIETISDYPNNRYTKTLSVGTYSWRIRAGNEFGYGPWSDTTSFSINELVLDNPLAGTAEGFPETIYVSVGMTLRKLVYKETGIGDYNTEGWQDRTGIFVIAFRNSSYGWYFNDSWQKRYEYNTNWSLNNGSDGRDGFNIDYTASGDRIFYYFTPLPTLASNPPIEKDGSCAILAFDWNFGQYPGDIQVSSSISADKPKAWWKVKLKADTEYTIQNRFIEGMPSSSCIRLYDTDGHTQLMSDTGSGSDYAQFNYTPTKTSQYFIVQDGYYYGDYGSYLLECSPAPLRGIATMNIDRCQCRVNRENIHTSSFDIVRYILTILQNSRWQIRENNVIAKYDECSIRAAAQQSYRIISAIRQQIQSRHSTEFSLRMDNTHRQNVICDSLLPTGWHLWARNIETNESINLGFISADLPADQRKLGDIPLADGTWQIEVRPQHYYWSDCRSRRIATLVTENGQIASANLPIIENLHRDIVNHKSIITWQIQSGDYPDDMHFAIWISADNPPDTSEPPIRQIPYIKGRYEYRYELTQTQTLYCTITARSKDKTAIPATISLPWQTTSPKSPENQLAKE